MQHIVILVSRCGEGQLLKRVLHRNGNSFSFNYTKWSCFLYSKFL